MLRKLEQQYTKNGLEINPTEHLTAEQEPVKNLKIVENKEIKGSEKCKYLMNKRSPPAQAQARTSMNQINVLLCIKKRNKTRMTATEREFRRRSRITSLDHIRNKEIR